MNPHARPGEREFNFRKSQVSKCCKKSELSFNPVWPAEHNETSLPLLICDTVFGRMQSCLLPEGKYLASHVWKPPISQLLKCLLFRNVIYVLYIFIASILFILRKWSSNLQVAQCVSICLFHFMKYEKVSQLSSHNFCSYWLTLLKFLKSLTH